MEKKKKYVFDFLYNIVAYSIPVFVNQIIILPTLGRMTPDLEYGKILAMINVINFFPFTLGNTLNNIRIIKNQEYDEIKTRGDFSIFLLFGVAGVSLFSFVSYTFFYDKIDLLNIFFFVALSLIWYLREYYIVVFRIKIDYKKILVNNLFMGTGYLFGLLLYIIGFFKMYWEAIYLLGQIASFIYLYHNEKAIFKEEIRVTPLFKMTSIALICLLFSNLLNSSLANIDKIFIQPLLGGRAVSIYHAASVFTKIVSTCTAPTAMVLLSYLGKKKDITKKSIYQTVIIAFSVALCGYVFCLCFGKKIIKLLYPSYYIDAIPYIWITSANTMVALVISIIRPFSLKFCKLSWQIVIGLISNVIYFSFVYFLIRKYQIYGVAVSYFWGLCAQLIILLFIISKKVR